jgi:hypothetical protein
MSDNRQNPLIYIGTAAAIAAGAFFFLKLNGAVQDKKQFDQLPPEIQRELEAASRPSEPIPPATPTLPAANLEDIDFTQYSQDLARWVELEMGETRINSMDKLRLYFAPERGDDIVNLRSSTFERDDGSVILFAKTGIKKDSVKAQEIYAVFSGPGGDAKFNQTLAAYGMRIKCYRGENTTEWQTDLCP